MYSFTCEQLIEALEKNRGFVNAACRYMYKTWQIKVSSKTIKSRIKEWGMEEWLEDMRKVLVEDCMQKAFHKGIAEGDNHCLFWVLQKYGHHVDYLSSVVADTGSKKGWQEILTHVKGTLKSDSEDDSSGEHGQT